MPARSSVQSLVQGIFHRWPRAQRVALQSLDLAYQLALLPFRRRRIRGAVHEHSELVQKTDAFNQAAEHYFNVFSDPQFLLDKPFSESHQVGKHLIDAGVLIDAMRLRPGDVVVELGAGSCWLSHFINRRGCRTISIDVSPSVLAIGRTLFERDPATNWSVEPQFLTYDGRMLPLPDASCDRIVINDAFHHIPNQRQMLREMRRVLRADGMVAMSEPGRGHGSTGHSLAESATGVLENELVLEDLAALAQECGFPVVNVLAASPFVRHEVPAQELGAFMGGKGFAGYWKTLCSALEQHHYLLCYAGGSELTTTRPGILAARIEVRRGDEPASRSRPAAALTVRITNAGDTRWISSEAVTPGWTRLGAHLYTAGSPPTVIDFDWLRVSLPADVDPQGHIEIGVTLPPLPAPGAYVVVFDLVVEGVTWFSDRGSATAALPVSA